MTDHNKGRLYEGSSESKEILVQCDSLIIFADGTYTCDHWNNNYFALWKIIDGIFHHHHAHYGDNDFQCQKGFEQRNSEIARRIIEAMDKKFEEEIFYG